MWQQLLFASNMQVNNKPHVLDACTALADEADQAAKTQHVNNAVLNCLSNVLGHPHVYVQLDLQHNGTHAAFHQCSRRVATKKYMSR